MIHESYLPHQQRRQKIERKNRRRQKIERKKKERREKTEERKDKDRVQTVTCGDPLLARPHLVSSLPISSIPSSLPLPHRLRVSVSSSRPSFVAWPSDLGLPHRRLPPTRLPPSRLVSRIHVCLDRPEELPRSGRIEARSFVFLSITPAYSILVFASSSRISFFNHRRVQTLPLPSIRCFSASSDLGFSFQPPSWSHAARLLG